MLERLFECVIALMLTLSSGGVAIEHDPSSSDATPPSTTTTVVIVTEEPELDVPTVTIEPWWPNEDPSIPVVTIEPWLMNPPEAEEPQEDEGQTNE